MLHGGHHDRVRQLHADTLHVHCVHSVCAGVCALHSLHAHRYGNYTPLTEAGRLASILFAAVGIPICFRACAQLARWMLRYLVGRLCGRPSAEDRGVRTLLALAVWALLQVRLKLGLPYPYP